jgi:hypothetical protein
MGKRKSLSFESLRKKIATKGIKFEAWCIKISDSREKKNQENVRKQVGERAGNKKMKQNQASKFATMEEVLLSFAPQARDHNLPLTREIINIKAKEFAEKLGNEP